MLIKFLAQPDAALVAEMRINAAKMLYNGQNTPTARRHIMRCTRYHRPTQAVLIFTRDGGMHSSGWWKNPDYERCFHLSISFSAFDKFMRTPLPINHKAAEHWAKAFFGGDVVKLWIEGAFSPEGKRLDVRHYRLFCDPAWKPIIPRREVYSKDYTPAEWQSWSDVHGYDNGDGEFGKPNATGEKKNG